MGNSLSHYWLFSGLKLFLHTISISLKYKETAPQFRLSQTESLHTHHTDVLIDFRSTAVSENKPVCTAGDGRKWIMVSYLQHKADSAETEVIAVSVFPESLSA